MEELIEFSTYSSMQYPIGEIVAKAHQLIEKEKEQISKAWSDGLNTERRGSHPNYTGKDYYEDTFKKQTHE